VSFISFAPPSSTPTIYSKVLVYLNGQLFSQNTSVKMTRKSGTTPQATLFKSYAGVKQGQSILEIDCSELVPVEGFELNSETGQFMGGNEQGFNSAPEFVTITLVAGGNTLTTIGTIEGDDIAYSVNSHTAMNFRFVGAYADWGSN